MYRINKTSHSVYSDTSGHGLILFFDSKRPVNLFFGLETILKYQHATMTNECYANHLLFYRCTRTGMLPDEWLGVPCVLCISGEQH